MGNRTIAFFTPENNMQVKIGDYYYNDGTLSHEYTKEKECIGIVFSTSSIIDGSKIFSHGSVVALTEFKDKENNLLHLWRKIKNDKGVPSVKEKNIGIEHILKILRTDYGGLSYSKCISDDEYVAINLAKNYPIKLPKGKTSGWYLPSSGQMWQIAYHFIDNEEFGSQESILNLAEKYIVSQDGKEVYPLSLKLKERIFKYEETDKMLLIRPVFSF